MTFKALRLFSGVHTIVAYDAAGDVTADGSGTGSHTYTWDAEGPAKTVSSGINGTETYLYDGLGERVEKQSAQVLFWYGAYGEMLEMTPALNGANPSDWIYFAGQRIARHDPGTAVYYLYEDALGSLRTITDATGNIVRDSDYELFGQELWIGGSGYDANQFAGMQERDEETGNDPTPNRMYAFSLVRWLSPTRQAAKPSRSPTRRPGTCMRTSATTR